MMNTIVRHIVIITIILPKHSLVWKLLEGSQNSVFNIKGKSKLNLTMGVVAWVFPVVFLNKQFSNWYGLCDQIMSPYQASLAMTKVSNRNISSRDILKIFWQNVMHLNLFFTLYLYLSGIKKDLEIER